MEQPLSDRGSVKLRWVETGKVYGAAGGIGLACDFFKPILDTTPVYLLVGIALAVGIPVYRRLKSEAASNEKLADLQKGGVMATIIGVVLIVGSYFFVGQSDRGLLVAATGTQSVQNEMLRSLEQIEDDMVRTAEASEDLRDELAQAAQETSSDPRKELANMGISWSRDSFSEALDARDTEFLQLFAEGGFPIQTWALLKMIREEKGDDYYFRIFGEYGRTNTAAGACEVPLPFVDELADGVSNPDGKRLLLELCDRQALRRYLRSELAEVTNTVAGYAAQSRDFDAMRSQCVEDNGSDEFADSMCSSMRSAVGQYSDQHERIVSRQKKHLQFILGSI